MSATYNWSLRPGVPNRYGFPIPGGADDAPWGNIGYAYVALFGNDLTGNGSRMFPYRTIQGANDAGANVMIIGSGVYRGVTRIGNYALADGDVTIDNTVIGTSNSIRLNGFKMLDSFGVGVYSSSYSTFITTNCRLNDISSIQYCIFKAPYGINVAYQYGLSTQGAGYNTFVDSPVNLSVGGNQTSPVWAPCCYFSIFDNCDISFTGDGGILKFDYSLFNNCRFRFGTGSYTAINTMADLKTFIQTVYPSFDDYQHCIMADPLFNNKAIGDYTLSYNSPAKNASYTGSFIGASSIATPIKATISGTTGFDTVSNINLNIDEDSITLSDVTQNAQIDSVVIPNLVQREIAKFPSYGFNADRNGQYIDSIADLDTVTISAGTVLAYPASYIIEMAAIDYNNHPLQAGERFTTVGSGTTFTTNSVGVVREILEAPQRHTIMARFSNGDSQPLTQSDPLTVGHWYYVSQHSMVHNGITYNEGDVFKAVNTVFTGIAYVTLAMGDETFQHYEPGIKPTSNNVGDVRSGAIIRGNGDPAYVRGALNVVEFPVNAKYIQIRYQIKVNNLKP